jgi:enamine deaminase RidA (YjgF/YER057c/UK114 family)
MVALMNSTQQTQSASAGHAGVTLERLNPAGLTTPEGYVHVVAVRGGRTVHVAGQSAMNAELELIGPGDLAAQTEQALRNVATALAGAGAKMEDVVRATIHVVDWDPSKLDALMDGVMRAAGDVGAPVAALTLVPVPRLYEDGMLIEIGVEAVVA